MLQDQILSKNHDKGLKTRSRFRPWDWFSTPFKARGSKSSWSQNLTAPMCSSKLSLRHAKALGDSSWWFGFQWLKHVDHDSDGSWVHAGCLQDNQIVILVYHGGVKLQTRYKQCSRVSFSRNCCMQRPSTWETKLTTGPWVLNQCNSHAQAHICPLIHYDCTYICT